MPRYATIADMNDCGIPPAALSGLDPNTVQRQLDRASAVADTMLGDKFTLPLVGPIDPTLTIAVCQIASWWLISRRGFNPDNPGDSVIRQNYLDGMALLKSIANGQARLNTKQSNPESQQPSVSTNNRRGYGGQLGDGFTDAPIIGMGNYGE